MAGVRDPVTVAVANAAQDRLAETDPEAALLGRLCRMLDVRPAAYRPEDMPEAAAVDLATPHAATGLDAVPAPGGGGFPEVASLASRRESTPAGS